jgi:hypothetical protein
MTKIIIALGGALTIALSFILFSFSTTVTVAIVASIGLAILASLRSENLSQVSLLALDLLFMLLVMVVFKETFAESMELFMLFVSVSLAVGSVDTLFFHGKKIHPMLGLVFTLFFWAPLSVPIYYIVERKMGEIGGIVVLIALFVIVVRDIFRRKKENLEV